MVHGLPVAPHTKGRVTKTFSGMAGVGVGFPAERTGRRKARLGFPGQHRHAGAGVWAGPLGREGGRQQALEGTFQHGVSPGWRRVSEFMHPYPTAQ